MGSNKKPSTPSSTQGGEWRWFVTFLLKYNYFDVLLFLKHPTSLHWFQNMWYGTEAAFCRCAGMHGLLKQSFPVTHEVYRGFTGQARNSITLGNVMAALGWLHLHVKGVKRIFVHLFELVVQSKQFHLAASMKSQYPCSFTTLLLYRKSIA